MDAMRSAAGSGGAGGAGSLIVGTWELVAVTSRDAATGEVRTPLGKATGRLIYTPSGQMSVVVTPRPGSMTRSPRRPRIGQRSTSG